MHILDARGEVWRTVVVIIPTLGAALIAGSRIMDARHHPFDVISGSLLGIIVAWISYRQYFPPLSDFRAKGRAYPIRSWGRPLSGDEVSRPPRFTGGYAPPAAQNDDEQQQPAPRAAQPAFTSGRGSPEHANDSQSLTGNAFRDEIHASQRQRQRQQRQPSTKTRSAAPLATSSTEAIAPAPQSYYSPAGNPFAAHRPTRGDALWDESSDEGAADEESGYELEPSYTLSAALPWHEGGTGAFEPFRGTDTGYHGKMQQDRGETGGAVGPELVPSAERERMPEGGPAAVS